MSRRSRISSKSVDWITLTVFLSLLIIGWLMLYAAVYDSKIPHAYLDFNTTIGKQTIWVGVAMVTFVLVYVIDWQFWDTFAFPIYGAVMLVLLLVAFFGTEIKGARSWFTFGGMSIQPSEIAKFATALAVSSYLASYKVDIRKGKNFFIALGLIGIPIVFIMLQPDLGSALVFLSFFILFYRRGLNPLIFILGFLAAAIFICSLVYDPQIVTLAAGLLGLGILVYNVSETWKSALIFLAIASLSLLLYVRDLYLFGLGVTTISLAVYSFLLFRESP